MSEVFELVFIGRGGQGAKTAAEMIARYALKNGKYVQSFPDYGPERKGAPVRAFTRISSIDIRGCSSEANPNVLIIIDPTLLILNGTLFNIKEGQVVLVNSDQSPESLKKELGFKGELYTVNATKIALDVMKSAITNTTMLGAFAKVTGYLNLEDLKKEIFEEFGKKLDEDVLNKNYLLTQRAFDEVR
jgi:pyruvate ferredoxin oxidoreductase gamma subunit